MATMTKTRDWAADKAAGYVAHYHPEGPNPSRGKIDTAGGTISGPDDAFICFGLPYEGSPWRNSRTGYDGRPQPCEPYVDRSAVSESLAGQPVEWVCWDESLACNVYRRAR